MREQPVILIVDDSPAGQETLRALLYAENYFLAFASNGLEALEKAARLVPDVILLDVMMPGMDGYEVCRRLRADPGLAEVPVIMLTALDDRPSRLQGIQAGADDFIAKPFDRGEMRARLRTLTRLNRYRSLHAERARFESLIELSPDGIFIIHPDGTIDQANRAARGMLAIDDSIDLLGRSLFELIDPEGVDSAREYYAQLKRGDGSAGRLEVAFKQADGNCLPVEIRATLLELENEVHIQIIARDIRERKAMEARLTYLAMYDGMTGLPNRNLLIDRLEKALGQARRNKTLVGLIHLDIDDFRTINQGLGMLVGDRVLVEAGQRFLTITRESDTLARISTDEFVLVLNNLIEEREIPKIAQKFQNTFKPPFKVMEQELYLSVSAGYCIYPGYGADGAELLKNANTALAAAKQTGKGNLCRYEPVMNTQIMDYLQITHQLRRAIDQNELEVFYQPKATLPDLRVIGLEALVRWRHPEWGMVSPTRFIPIAEESGLIHDLGRWVLQESCRQLPRFTDAGLGCLPVAVNVSPIQFRQPNFVEETIRQIELQQADPSNLEIEITETLFMRDRDDATNKLRRLQKYGIRVALDDFGTEYSSLSVLRNLPVNVLKIAKPFIDDLHNDTEKSVDNSAFVKAIVALGHSLQMEVLAEGVETEQQKQTLASLGCDQIQGYLLAKPMPADQVIAWLQAYQNGR